MNASLACMNQPDHGNTRPETTTDAGTPVTSQEHSLTVGPRIEAAVKLRSA